MFGHRIADVTASVQIRLGLHASQLGHETEERDLGRCAEALRWTPVAGAAARVDPQPAEPCEAGGERLLEAHEQVPRQELPPVRVARELQVESRRRRRE